MTSPRVRRKSGDSDFHVYSVSLLVMRVGRVFGDYCGGVGRSRVSCGGFFCPARTCFLMVVWRFSGGCEVACEW